MRIHTAGGAEVQNVFLEDYAAPLSSVLGAVASDPLLSPLELSLQQERLKTATEGPPVDTGLRGRRASWGPVGARQGPESPIVSAEEARDRVTEAGYDIQIPDEGIPEEALNMLMQVKRQERVRQDLLNRAPGGFVPGLLKFGTALGASMLDPVNVASAFIPVVGPGRYARMIENAGSAVARAGVRARVGAAEGLVGAAAVEPLVYSGAQELQLDYGMTDAMLNISLGTILGGGLHMGAGAVNDALEKGVNWKQAQPQGEVPEKVASWSPQQRGEAARIAVAQAFTGRKVDLQAWTDFRDATAELRPGSMAEARRQAVQDLEDEMRQVLLPEAGQKLDSKQTTALRKERRDVQAKLDAAEGNFRKATRRLQKERKLPREQAEKEARKAIEADRAELQARLDRIDDQINKQEVAVAAEGDLSRVEQGRVPERFKERVEQRAAEKYQRGNLTPVAHGVRQALAGQQKMDRTWREVRNAAVRQGRPEASMTADFDAANAHIERLRDTDDAVTVESAQADLDEELLRLQELADAMEAEDAAAGLDEFDEAIDQAGTLGRALRGFALCQLRRT